ncbi:hypothetical protein CERSUDRAFT_133798 [Gelatoporia subvermispora B]|uniref:Zn(2)-C6 fungal-type domain-containing protein n=1 Tax=Ceriporiopsis subvermispora (strain B) TaxID=914234 RepID=M2PR40_CERS8|nr:hypothetical protein CERSUDRAFT_133798 [Gelatoporia subvermispora B]
MSSSSNLVSRTKKRNAPLSCAECRRLKLRCSRVFPCASCVKKGCAAICPDGSLTTGKGNRFVLANTEELHDKITQLASRVRQLEDALQAAHGQLSNEPHHLLSEELLQIKRPLEREAPEDVSKEPDPETAEAIDAVGSLSITESGHTKFFGTTANSWYLLLQVCLHLLAANTESGLTQRQNEDGGDDDVESPQVTFPAELPWLNHTFPFASTVDETAVGVRQQIIQLLPDAAKARQLAEIYYKHAAWMYTPLPEAEFYGSIFPRIYGPMEISPDQDSMASHRLAVMYLVLALGTLLDLERPSFSPEATRYYQLGRAALSLDSVLESQSIPAIQALVLMCHFMFLSFVEGPRWALMGLAVKLAQSLGLHRDSGKWNLKSEETFRRRSLFYELYTYDSWQSLTFGRPPSFSSAFIDTQMASEPTKTDTGEIEMSFADWKHRFSSRCLNIVHEQAFGARTPTYRMIQELDKKVRSFYVPPSLRVPGFGGAKMEVDPAPCTIELTMQRYIAFAIREMTLFYMHRGFFARAIEDHPDDPLGSKYAPSVLAAYNSACAFVGLIKSLYSQQPGLTERMWFLFTHVFSCAIVLGSIATKCPSMALAPSALSHLESACSLFEGVSENARAAKVLPVLRKLKGRAIVALSQHQARASAAMSGHLHMDTTTVKQEDEELAALGGKTRLVSRKSPSLPSSPHGSSSQASSSPRDLVADQSFYPPAGHTSQIVHAAEPPQQHPLVEEPAQWQGYQQPQGYNPPPQGSHTYNHQSGATPEYYDYQEFPPTPQWQPHGYNYGSMQQQMALDLNGMQYGTYQQQPSAMVGQYVPGHSPLESPLQSHGIDPDASWRNLFAQYQV